MTTSHVFFEKCEGVAYVTRNRPEKRNAFSPEMIVRLVEIWAGIAEDPTVRAVLLTGAGTPAFSSGGDLGTTIPLMMRTRQPQGEWEERFAADRKQLYAAILRNASFFKPVVAAINGHALAGGAEMILSTDLRVMSEDATIGLVNRVVPAGDVLATAEDLARRISLGAPVALAKTKEAMVRSNGLSQEEAFAVETGCTRANAKTEDAKEGPRAFMEKRPPVFTGR